MSNLGTNMYNLIGKLRDVVSVDKPAEPTVKETVYESVEPRGSITEAVKSLEDKFANFSEGIEDKIEAAREKAAAAGKTIKDKETPKSNVRTVKGKAYGGSAQKDAEEKDDLDEGAKPDFLDVDGDGNKKETFKKAAKDNEQVEEGQGPYELYNPKHPKFKANYDKWMAKNPGKKLEDFINAMKKREASMNEVAPPGAKAERMVKHIKKGYADDGKLTKKEKGIAYATAWKAHNKGQVEEGVEFKDTVKNSSPKLTKVKATKLKESRMIQEGDYYYESIGKALAEKNPNLDTASSDFYAAVRQEMVAQGMKPNQARNILAIDEDFLMDVATSYAHYCKELAECDAPVNSHLGGDMQELDEIAKLAGLTTEMDSKVPGDSDSPLTHAHEAYCDACDHTEDQCVCGHEEMREEEMEEGNEFSGALAKAKATGAKEFEVDGKKYTVKEDININITASGEEDALNLIRKLSGMDEVESHQAVELPQDAETAIAQGVVEPVEVEVDEERDIEYTNTPNEKIGPVDAAIPSGTDMHRAKKSYSDKPYRGDNPMAVKEEVLWKQYESMINDVKE